MKYKARVKCQRCVQMTALSTSIKNTEGLIASYTARGYDIGLLEKGNSALNSELALLRQRECSCVFVYQDEFL